MIQNLPSVGRAIPGQRINMPAKKNRTRPFLQRPNVSVATDGDGNPNIVLTYTLKNGQQRAAWYLMPSELVAHLLENAVEKTSQGSGSGSGYAGANRGGAAFNVNVRSQPVVISTTLP